MKLFVLFLTFISSLHCLAVGAQGPIDLEKKGLQNKKLPVLAKIGIDEHMGEKIDLNLEFIDEKNQTVKLGKYFNKKPVFMLLVYYECPTLCSLHLNALMNVFKNFEWTIGEEFEFVAVSIDSGESPRVASKKLEAYYKSYGREKGRDGWHFLTGEDKNIKALASQIGFKYAWDPREQAWAHAAAAYILTPEGKISYYHYGLQIEKKVLRLSLVDAAENKIGTILDRLVLFCLQYDPDKKTYAFYAFNIMKVAGLLTIFIFGFFLFRFWRKEKLTTLNNENKEKEEKEKKE